VAGAGRRGLWLALAAVVLAAAAIAAGLWLYERGLVRPAYPDPREYPVRGIDVSHHQGAIGWRQVKGSGVTFAYLKASEGGDHRDRTFTANAQAAAQVGLPVGAYHYFTFCRGGVEQAQNFLAATATARLRLPAAIDLEFGGNCAERPGRAAFNHELAVFIQAVRKTTGREPILYVTPEFHTAYLRGGPFQRRGMWVRDLVGGLNAPAAARVRFWQYAARGRVAGIEGPVDLNVFVGDAAAFRGMLGP
jgi:lysozyme